MLESLPILDALQKMYASNGRMFTAIFCKRETGELRKMNCRIGVKKHLKGGEAAYNFASKGLISVCEVNAPKGKKNGFKAIPWKGLQELHIDGRKYTVQH